MGFVLDSTQGIKHQLMQHSFISPVSMTLSPVWLQVEMVLFTSGHYPEIISSTLYSACADIKSAINLIVNESILSKFNDYLTIVFIIYIHTYCNIFLLCIAQLSSLFIINNKFLYFYYTRRNNVKKIVSFL